MAVEAGTRPRAYGLRKRRSSQELSAPRDGLPRLEAIMDAAKKVVIFSGSGLSATSGMSTFSTKGGLYERAQKRFRVADGKSLFTYAFYAKNPRQALSFLADVHAEAAGARASPGHYALALLSSLGRLQRHYTLNIDGLSQAAQSVMPDSLSTVWHPEDNPTGQLVELHGSIHELVCGSCGATVPATPAMVGALRAEEHLPCACGAPHGLRFKVMLYDDAEGSYITPDEVMDVMEEDVKSADVILWAGISFQQSASTSYFRSVRRWLAEAGRDADACPQVVLNPSDEAVWNLRTASCNLTELEVLEVLATCDAVLPVLATRAALAGGLEPPLVEESSSNNKKVASNKRLVRAKRETLRRLSCDDEEEEEASERTTVAVITTIQGEGRRLVDAAEIKAVPLPCNNEESAAVAEEPCHVKAESSSLHLEDVATLTCASKRIA